MELFFWIVGLLWVAGWVREMAHVSAKMTKHKLEYPNDGVKYATSIILLVAWPYFYFYGKAS